MEPFKNTQDDWGRWANKVLGDLERLGGVQNDIQKQLVDIRIEIATLKAKAGVWGAIAGAIGSTVIAVAVKSIGP